MQIQLIDGHFSAKDAMEILTRLTHAKIKFHEDRISQDATEEDAKMRETRIKALQKDLYEMKRFVENSDSGDISIYADIKLEKA